jgi:hypothetical protein
MPALRIRRALLAALVAVLLVSGCTIRREYDVDILDLERLQLLESANDKAAVLEQVGPPHSVGIQLDGSVFVYRTRIAEVESLNLSAFRASFDYETTDRRTARLIVLFDKQGRKVGQGFDGAQDADTNEEEAGD